MVAALSSSVKTLELFQSQRQSVFRVRDRSVTVYARKATGGKKRKGPMGFVAEDNSGKANIFAVEPSVLWTSSKRSEQVAKQGLGGPQGLLLVAGLIALVALVTVGQGLSPAESLKQVAEQASTEPLTSIASRISNNL